MPRDLDEHLNDLIDGRLPADAEREFRARLAQEPALRERHDELLRMGALLRASDPARGVEVPAGFASQVHARIEGHGSIAASDAGVPVEPDRTGDSDRIDGGAQAGRSGGRMFRFLAVAYAAAAVIVLGVTLVVTLRDDPAPAGGILADKMAEDRKQDTKPAAAPADRTLDQPSGGSRPEQAPTGGRSRSRRDAGQGSPHAQPEVKAKPEPGTLGANPRGPRVGKEPKESATGGQFGAHGSVRPGLRKASDDGLSSPKGAPSPKLEDARRAGRSDRSGAGGEPDRGPPAAPIQPPSSGVGPSHADGIVEEQASRTQPTFVLTTTDVDATLRALKQRLPSLAVRAPQAKKTDGKAKKTDGKVAGKTPRSAPTFAHLERELARAGVRIAQATETRTATGGAKNPPASVEVEVTPAQLAHLLELTRAARSGRWAAKDADDTDGRPKVAPGASGPSTPASPRPGKSTPAPSAAPRATPPTVAPAAPAPGGAKSVGKRIRIRILVEAR